MNESTSIGARIAARRKQLGLTQRELAEQMGVTDKAVSKWERDLARPDVQSLPHLADILGLSIETLMDDTPPAMTPSKKNDAPKTLRLDSGLNLFREHASTYLHIAPDCLEPKRQSN